MTGSRWPWRKRHIQKLRMDHSLRALGLEAMAFVEELRDIIWECGGLRSEWLDSGMYLANQIGISRRKFVALWALVRHRFVEISPGLWSDPEVRDELYEVREFSEKQSNRAKQRATGTATAEPRAAEPSEIETEKEIKRETEIKIPPTPQEGGLRLVSPEAQEPKRKPKRDLPLPSSEALEILQELNTKRQEVIPRSRPFPPIPRSVEFIQARLRDGYTVDDCKHVIGVCAKETREDPTSGKWFDTVSPFRPENFLRKLGRTLDGSNGAPKPRGGLYGAFPMPGEG